MQIGGIGFMTLVSSLGLFMKRKINLYERKALMQSAGNFQPSGIVALVKKIMIITFTVELISTGLIMIRTVPAFGLLYGFWQALFISVSSFCTAGIDVMPGTFTSLTYFEGDWLISIVLSLEMFIGALGFLVINDVFSSKGKWKKLHLHSKIVLITSTTMCLVAFVLIFLFEKDYTSEGLADALFNTISGNATGFNSVVISNMTQASKMVLALIMFVGGSPGSTAGGIKTTTFVVLLFSLLNGATKSSTLTIGNRSINKNAAKQASAIFFLYISAIFIGTTIILASDNSLAMDGVIFECVSAVDNVGLSLGVTSLIKNNTIAKFVLTILMYIGRIGPVTTISLVKDKEDDGSIIAPTEEILLG
jgi:trk system potassium uptake protein TrkH